MNYFLVKFEYDDRVEVKSKILLIKAYNFKEACRKINYYDTDCLNPRNFVNLTI